MKKIFAAVVSLVVLIGASVCIGAAGSNQLSITAKNVNSGEVEIKLSNTSEYYLGNVKIKVTPVSGSGAKVSSFGIGNASGASSVHSVAPGGSVSVYAKVSVSNTANNQQTTATTAKKPSQNSTAAVKNPVSTTNGKVDGTTAATGTVADSVISDTEISVTDESAETTDEAVETTVGSVHSIAPGESATVVADMSDDDTDAPADSEKADGEGDEDSSAVIWIVCGIAAVLIAAGVVVFIVIKKKKNITKNISAVIVIAVILSVFASANGGVISADAADEITTPTAGSVSITHTLSGGKGSITIAAEYTIAPKAQAQALKNNRKAPSNEECNNANTNKSQIVEGAGPLTGFNLYIGKNDFMFYGDAIKDYTGSNVMNAPRLNKLSKMMNDRDTWAKENGIKLYLVIAPNKTSVYPDYVPSSVTAATKTNADAVVEHLAKNSTVEVIDLRATLKNARSTYGDNLFYKYDTHWNNNGGFVGYTEMMRRISEDVPGTYTLKKSDYTVTQAETYMKDMAWYLGHYNAYTDYGPVYTLNSGMTATIKNKGEYQWTGQYKYASRWTDGYSDSLKYVTYENVFNTSAPSVYMYRDSFSVSMLHFVKDSFHKSYFDWSYEFCKEEILASGAKVVIMEVVEKQLTDFTNTRTFTIQY